MTRPITFLSDYGTGDEFAGVCRAVIARIAPGAPVIDITHSIAREDVRAGARALANAIAYAPAGVHLAVVDPGVGTDRRALAVRAAVEERILVGPDNGLLVPALERLGGAAEAVEISASPARLEPVSATFHGRDVFAPVAATAACGRPLRELGEPIDPGSLVELRREEPSIEPGRSVLAAVAVVDGFGNAALELTPGEAGEAGLLEGGEVTVSHAGVEGRALYGRAFGDVAPGALLVHVDSTGSVAVAANRASAAELLGLSAGDRVLLRPALRLAA